jgi:CDP-glycerol glycerophosphotransferase (TagB/SpsB family)
VERISRQYGRFILCNTNFSFGNHFFGEGGFVDFLERSGKIRDERHRAFYVGLQQHQERLFDEFTASIKTLHEHFPDIKVLVRPHPSENHERWREVLPQHENILVKHEGNVLPWLMAAKVVIHNSCTTGVEAYLLERPVIAYLPVRDEAFEGELANKLADLALNRDDLLQFVGHYVSKEALVETDAERQALAAQHITALDGPLAADRIVELLQTIEVPQRSLGERVYQQVNGIKKVRGKISLRKFAGLRVPETRDEAADKHKQQKFPGVELAEVHESMEKFHTLLNRFSELQATQLGNSLFSIHRR